MANYAGIAIGINRYQFLQPLSFGQGDAQALRQFLVRQANLPSSECLLLTDTSPLVDNQPTYPSGETIWRWLEVSRQQPSPPGKWRWFFFSGYGVCWDNIDYLMPIDGNPHDIPRTGISVRSLFNTLKTQNQDNLLVILDINRSPGLPAGTSPGAQTLELARQMGIALVLSSQLEQFSHEAAGLGHGLFTAALLEALRYYNTDITLEHLDSYLRVRLPELCQHHWRPVQSPMMVIPSEDAKQQLILPTLVNAPITSPITRPNLQRMPTVASGNQTPEVADVLGQNAANGLATGGIAVETRLTPPPTPATQPTPPPAPIVHHPNHSSQPSKNAASGWKQLLAWGGVTLLLMALMVGAVFLRNRDIFMRQQVKETPTSPSDQTAPPPTSPSDQTAPPPAPSDPTLPTSSAVVNPPSPNAQEQPLAVSPQSNRLQANQAVLDRAKGIIRPNQASLFNRAIVQARAVQPGDPLYAEAQASINRWSAVILDLAAGRANQGNFAGAIAAAQLVPKDDVSVYTKAQQSINQWKALATQQQQNRGIIQTAKQQIQPNQASSYNRALTTLRKIQPNQPGYAEAQQLTGQWSRMIYLIAQSRAARKSFPSAIQTAALVPSGTPSYTDAQKAIAQWKLKAKPTNN